MAWSLLTADWKVGAVSFIAPMASPSAYRTIFHRALGLSEDVEARFVDITARRFGFRWEDLEVPEMARRMKTPPVLVVHDRDDRETSWAEGAAIAEAWPESLLHMTARVKTLIRTPLLLASTPTLHGKGALRS